MKKKVFVVISGLMEHEGRTEIREWGEGEGDTLEEVCRDIVENNPEKAKNFRCYENRCYDWGFTLRFDRRS